jgi:hypothetical protein
MSASGNVRNPTWHGPYVESPTRGASSFPSEPHQASNRAQTPTCTCSRCRRDSRNSRRSTSVDFLNQTRPVSLKPLSKQLRFIRSQLQIHDRLDGQSLACGERDAPASRSSGAARRVAPCPLDPRSRIDPPCTSSDHLLSRASFARSHAPCTSSVPLLCRASSTCSHAPCTSSVPLLSRASSTCSHAPCTSSVPLPSRASFARRAGVPGPQFTHLELRSFCPKKSPALPLHVSVTQTFRRPLGRMGRTNKSMAKSTNSSQLSGASSDARLVSESFP